MRSIYEIDAEILDCISEDGEIIDEEKLDALVMEKEKKVENILLWIKDIKAEKEAVKAEKMTLAKRQQTLENKEEALKNYISLALHGEKFSTSKVQASFRRSTSVECDVEQLMLVDDCDRFLRYKAPEANKEAIAEYLKSGKHLPGCYLVEKNSVIIK